MTAWFDKVDHHIQTLTCFKHFLEYAKPAASTCSFDDLVGIIFFWGMAKRRKAAGTAELLNLIEER
jgi:hypothetical protein